MHTALLTNTAWLDEQLRLFRQLVVGLIDEQVRVTQVIPDELAIEEANVFGQVVTWRDSRWPWTRRFRLMRLADELDRLGVDLIHAMDGRLWQAAVRLADRLGVPAVLQAASVFDIREIDRLPRRGPDSRVAFVAATQPLREAIVSRVSDECPVEVMPLGVYIPEQRSARPSDAGLLCVVVSGTGEVNEDYEALFTAMRALLDEYPQVQFFLDGQRTEQHGLWQLAKRMRLLENVSLVPRRLGHRELLVKADVLVHPQATGRARSLTLQAMAAGLPVLAKADRWVDDLVHDKTAWLVESADSEAWERLLRRVVQSPQEAWALGEQARAWVAQRHQPSTQVASTAALYRRLTGESWKFSEETSSSAERGEAERTDSK